MQLEQCFNYQLFFLFKLLRIMIDLTYNYKRNIHSKTRE